MTRITQNMMSRTLLSDLQDVTDRLARTQAKLSSGKELTMPSDNPYAVSRALQFRADLAQNQQYQRNVDEASSWQSTTDTALGQVGDLALRARDLLVQGASDSTGTQGRLSIANEIDQLIDSIKSTANAQYAGRYVFSGSLTTTPPYATGASDAYAGNTEVLRREIGPGVQIDLNQPGSSVIGDDRGGLLATLRTISADLKSGNATALQGADMQALDGAYDALTASRATLGAVTNRLESAKDRLGQVEDATSKLLSETEDADMAKTLIDFSMQQAVYQSALKSGAQIIQPSLMDFLS